MDDCIVQVTQWQKSEALLDGWMKYLTSKGYSLNIRKKLNMEKKTVYSLFRNLNETEKEEIKSKKYALVGNSLERRDVNGRRIK